MSKIKLISTYRIPSELGKIKIHEKDFCTLVGVESSKNDFTKFLHYRGEEKLVLDILNKPGIYFLYNRQKQMIYIGQSITNINNRLKNHIFNPEKDEVFHDVLLVIDKGRVNISHEMIDYLEWYYINKVQKQNYWIYENKNLRVNKPNVTMATIANADYCINLIDDFLEVVDIDLNIRNSINNDNEVTSIVETKQNQVSNEIPIFKLANAYMVIDSNGIRILKNSKIINLKKCPRQSKYFFKNRDRFQNRINELLANGNLILDPNDELYYLVKYDFYVPSVSSFVFLANGYIGKINSEIRSVQNPELSLKEYLESLNQ